MAAATKISTEDWIEELKGISVLELSEPVHRPRVAARKSPRPSTSSSSRSVARKFR